MKEQLVELSSRYDETAQDSGTGRAGRSCVCGAPSQDGRPRRGAVLSKFTDALADARATVNELATRYARRWDITRAFHPPGISCPCAIVRSQSKIWARLQGDLKRSLRLSLREDGSGKLSGRASGSGR